MISSALSETSRGHNYSHANVPYCVEHVALSDVSWSQLEPEIARSQDCSVYLSCHLWCARGCSHKNLRLVICINACGVISLNSLSHRFM